MARPSFNLLALSDLHLGSDLVHHAQPDAPVRTPASERRDRALVALLDWYRERPVEGQPWRLVIGGDFVDLTGMSVLPAPGERADDFTEPTGEELSHGLGGAADHALAKLRLVMAHHASVMDALARFLAAGNELVIVPGNHDVDWHWDALQVEFRQALAERAGVGIERIQFSHWFYYEEGLIYLEHGHQYDGYCSHDHVLYPVSPRDPRRTTQSLSDILVRYVVRPTRGMTEGGHDSMSASDYVRFGLSLGVGGMATLVRRFVNAAVAAVELWREHLSDAAAFVRREHERKLQQLGEARSFGIERLRELVRLQHPPLTRNLGSIASSLMLDRIALGALALAAVGAVLLWLEHWGVAASSGVGVLGGVAVMRHLWLQRSSVEPSDLLRERAGSVARLFPAAVVVMGHTHLPEMRPTSAQSTYVNLGAWAEEEPVDGRSPALPATRTHLLITRSGGAPSAQLLTWSDGGPQPFDTERG
ncbi:MAG TPA: metallophosphoesterase [Polyangiaceae bacterium]|nr:metallophosphoesterase [Polyangiaceae bacterium]